MSAITESGLPHPRRTYSAATPASAAYVKNA